MHENEIRSQAIEALTEVAPDIDGDTLDPDVAYHAQYDFDSVDFLSFVLALEKRLSVKVPELDYPRLSTLNGCVAYLVAMNDD
jgi:acyl carrier protein